MSNEKAIQSHAHPDLAQGKTETAHKAELISAQEPIKRWNGTNILEALRSKGCLVASISGTGAVSHRALHIRGERGQGRGR